MPPSTDAAPNYGVMGMVQVVPTSIAWLWRLVSPRGFKNPSIADSNAGSGLKAEGVGSYWPFSTGKKVTTANLLLNQMLNAPNTLNVLIPNQYIGAYHVGFMGEWLTREYLARHNGTVRKKHLVPARNPIFGYSLEEMKIDGQYIRLNFLRPELQVRLGDEGYDEYYGNGILDIGGCVSYLTGGAMPCVFLPETGAASQIKNNSGVTVSCTYFLAEYDENGVCLNVISKEVTIPAKGAIDIEAPQENTNYGQFVLKIDTIMPLAIARKSR